MTAVGASAGSAPPKPLSASITPSSVVEVNRPGSYTSPLFVCSGSGGAPPYSYEWSVTPPFSLSSTNDNETRVKTGGSSGEQFGVVTCNVTDSDSGSVSVNASISVIFGGILL